MGFASSSDGGSGTPGLPHAVSKAIHARQAGNFSVLDVIRCGTEYQTGFLKDGG
jgi:hypothetical protein